MLIIRDLDMVVAIITMLIIVMLMFMIVSKAPKGNGIGATGSKTPPAY